MKIPKFKHAARIALLPLACAGLVAACAPYDTYPPAPVTARIDTPMTVFDRLDTNHDGFLSRAELETLRLPAAVPAPAENPKAMFERLDLNRDGFLSRAEAGTTFNTIPGGSFDAFDTNRDGFLSMSEALPHLQWLQRGTLPMLSFDALDRDRDGFLTRSEAEPLMGSTHWVDGRWIVVYPTNVSVFDQLDVNRDSYLSRAEASSWMNPATFDRYDTNRDGFLSRWEADPFFRSNVGGTGAPYGGTIYGPRY